MRKRDELTDPRSCMSKAGDDEWTFVLLGRDAAAPVAVRAWIEERIRLGKNKPYDSQIREAEQWIRTVMQEQYEAANCEILCCHCRKPIRDSVYFQGDSRAHPSHKGCLIVIKRAPDGGI